MQHKYSAVKAPPVFIVRICRKSAVSPTVFGLILHDDGIITTKHNLRKQ